MEAFITGSRAYGKPTEESDVDLVVRVSDYTANRLRKLSDNGKEPIRFGNLNLILCTSDEAYATWLIGTTHLKNKKHSRGCGFKSDAAKKILDGLRAMVNLEDEGQSGADK